MPSKKHSLFLPFSGLLIALIFAVDARTPLGYAEWTLYVIPVALCLFVGEMAAPLVAALCCSALLALGYYLSPPGSDSHVALINRALGAVGLWVVALVGSRFISARREIERLTWLERGKALVASRIAGVQTPEEMGASVLAAFVEYTRCVVGVFYRRHGDRMVRIAATAVSGATPHELPLGSTLAGQSAADGLTRVIGPVADGYLDVGSALGRMAPRAVVVAPTVVDDEVNGLMEIAYLERPEELALVRELLAACSAKLGVALAAALSRIRLQELLEETQHQHEELQTQQEELRVSNEELEERGNILKESKAQLERQQAELEHSNVQLEAYSNHLERQKQELLTTQRTLKENAEALERSNQYKSEFLANMSHELRTPLNSSLILSRLLAENADGSLSEIQVRYARTIQASNNDLLNLINDILDLSKIESGKVETIIEPVDLPHLLEPLKLTFEPIAADARLGFRIEVAEDVPGTLVTDLLRVQQILRNLLSNAFKFTRAGEVVLGVTVAAHNEIRFAVRDTGIGIPEAQQQVIFEAFRQADGSTSREFGGTGLGLSISKELARLLQGSIGVVSSPSQGSTFTLTLPLAPDLAAQGDQQPARPGAWTQSAGAGVGVGGERLPPPMTGFTELKEAMDALTGGGQAGVAGDVGDAGDAREAGDAGDMREAGETGEVGAPTAEVKAEGAPPRGRTILLIEDDASFSDIVKQLTRELDFDCVAADNANDGLAMARELQPRGILLDLGLPDRSGLAVLEQLKRDPVTRPIPVHVISASDHTQVALELGAIGYILKPAMREQLQAALVRVEEQSRREVKSVLIVEDDATLRDNLMLLLKAEAVELVGVGTVQEAMRMLDVRTFDCMVMDLGLPDGSGYELLERLSKADRYSFPPVIVYTGRSITREEEQRLRRYSRSIIIKGARSPDRLVDEVSLFLHQVEARLPADHQRMLKMARSRDSVLEGRKILLAEDDVRNVFALINVLEPLGALVEIARNGREALEKLRAASTEIDLVLMDIMMPEVDGLTAIREIRADDRLAKVPIIALTANAMPEDRVRCLEAGADDYIAKPIDVDRLVSLCRVWMPK